MYQVRHLEEKSAQLDQDSCFPVKRLKLLAAWRDALGLYTERERAALALTEAVTLIAQTGVHG